jgi:hypothetical protein
MNKAAPVMKSMAEEGSGMPTVWYALAVAVPISSSDVVVPSAKEVASSAVGKADNERATSNCEAALKDSLLYAITLK